MDETDKIRQKLKKKSFEIYDEAKGEHVEAVELNYVLGVMTDKGYEDSSEVLKFYSVEDFCKFAKTYFKNLVIVKAEAKTATKENIAELQKKNPSIEAGEIYLEFEVYRGEPILLSLKDFYGMAKIESDGFTMQRKPPRNVAGVGIH